MADQRKKLELELNKPVNLELLFNEPMIGQSQFGEYYLYAMKNGHGEVSFFAPADVHQQLKELKKGDRVTITKTAEQKGSKIVVKYDVQVLAVQPVQDVQGVQNKTPEPPKDNYFEILYKCYKDALRLQELSPMIQPEKAAITLFIARQK